MKKTNEELTWQRGDRHHSDVFSASEMMQGCLGRKACNYYSHPTDKKCNLVILLIPGNKTRNYFLEIIL